MTKKSIEEDVRADERTASLSLSANEIYGHPISFDGEASSQETLLVAAIFDAGYACGVEPADLSPMEILSAIVERFVEGNRVMVGLLTTNESLMRTVKERGEFIANVRDATGNQYGDALEGVKAWVSRGKKSDDAIESHNVTILKREHG